MKKSIFLLLTGSGFLIFLMLYTACQKGTGSSTRSKQITIALYPGDYSLIFPLAQHLGYFHENGLRVTLKETPSGLLALGELEQKKADFACSAEIAFVSKIRQNQGLRILASLATSDSNELVARKDRGITSPEDLVGKKVGIVFHTTSEYFLRSFLAMRRVSIDDLTLVDLPPPQFVTALQQGEVDAVCAWDRHVFQIKNDMKEQVVCWPAQDQQDFYWVLVTTQDRIQTDPELIPRLLRSLVMAEDYIRKEHKQMQPLLAKIWEKRLDYIQYIWPRVRFNVALDQALIVAMENEESVIHRHETKFPNYLDLIYKDGLRAVKPTGVTIYE